MADWSGMHRDLLQLIARCLDTWSDVLRFRSVCSSWRSSVAPSPNRFRRWQFTINRNERDPDSDSDTEEDCVMKYTIFLLGVPRSRDDQTVPSGWLVKVQGFKVGEEKAREDVPRKMYLLNPLSSRVFAPLPEDFPKVLDVMNLRVLELGHEYVSRCFRLIRGRGCYDVHFPEKVALMWLDNGDDFALLRIASGKLAMCKSKEKRWSVTQDMPSPYDDVILFKGEFYAVDGAGRTVVVGLDSRVTLIVQSNFCGRKKFLVESVGELLLVDMYWSPEIRHHGEYYPPRDVTVQFKVYKLDRAEQVWNEVKELGDRVLFLGDSCAFSASAADLGACKGNCICYGDHFREERQWCLKISVYDMDSGVFGPMEDYAGYSDLFRPPSDWIAPWTSEPQKSIGSTSSVMPQKSIGSTGSVMRMLGFLDRLCCRN